MTIDLNRLHTMKKEELIELAKQTGTPFHHRNSEKTLVENIINHTMKQPKKEVKVTEQKEIVYLTEEELETALKPIKERHKAFSTIYDHENNCVTMKYFDGRYSHSETMNLSCPLTKFKRKAAEIAKGPLLMPTHNERDFERLGVTGKNAYTAAVLG